MRLPITLAVTALFPVFVWADEWKPSYPAEARATVLMGILPAPESSRDWISYLADQYSLNSQIRDRVIAGLTRSASPEVLRWADKEVKTGAFDTPIYVFALAILAKSGIFPSEYPAEIPGATETKSAGEPLVFAAQKPNYRYSGLASSLYFFVTSGDITWPPGRLQARVSEAERQLLVRGMGEDQITNTDLSELRQFLQSAHAAHNSTAEVIFRHALINQTGDILVAVEGLRSKEPQVVAAMAVGLSWLGNPEAVGPLLLAAKEWEHSENRFLLHYNLVTSLSQFDHNDVVEYFTQLLERPDEYGMPMCLKVIVNYLAGHISNESVASSLLSYYYSYNEVLLQLQPIITDIHKKFPEGVQMKYKQ